MCYKILDLIQISCCSSPPLTVLWWVKVGGATTLLLGEVGVQVVPSASTDTQGVRGSLLLLVGVGFQGPRMASTNAVGWGVLVTT